MANPIYLDPTQSAEDNFFNVVRADNPKATHLKGRVTLGEPVTDSQTGLTTVILTSIPGEGYIEPIDVVYHRQRPVEASGTLNYGNVKLNAVAFSQSALIDLIAAHFKVIKSDVVIAGFGVDGAILFPRWKDEVVQNGGFTITPKPESLVYHNGGQASFSGQFENSFIRTDKQPVITALAYPVATRTTESDTVVKQRIATLIGLTVGQFKLGVNADDVFSRPAGGLVTDGAVKITTTDPTIAFAGATSSSINLRLPSIQYDDIPSIVGTTGWVNDPTNGWYNNTTPWDTKHTLTQLPAIALTALKRISAVFTGYYNTPAGSMSQNYLATVENAAPNTAAIFGVTDPWDAAVSGMQYYDEGVATTLVQNVIGMTLKKTFAVPTALKQIDIYSNYFTTFPKSSRGFKNLKLEFFVSE